MPKKNFKHRKVLSYGKLMKSPKIIEFNDLGDHIYVKGKASFKNFYVLLDIGCSYTIVKGRIVKTIS